jgi:hypothetical protein
MQVTESKPETASGAAFFEILAASGRSPDIAPEDDLFGFLVGSWSLDVMARDDTDTVIRSKAEAHAARTLEGRAVQDVFINPRRADRGLASPRFANWYGTTLRYYDPTIRSWRSYWFNPEDGFRAELIARRHGNDIVQEGTFPDGTPIRWVFSEIGADSYRWRGERLEGDGRTWRLQVEFHARRMT